VNSAIEPMRGGSHPGDHPSIARLITTYSVCAHHGSLTQALNGSEVIKIGFSDHFILVIFFILWAIWFTGYTEPLWFRQPRRKI